MDVDPNAKFPPMSQLEELEDWWMKTAKADFEMMLPKLKRYGAYDLKIMGAEIAHLTGVVRGVQLSALAEELAIWFYVSGKVARLQAEYEQGLPGDPDHWVDTSIYSFMARRIQEAGGWPWKEDPE